MDVAVAYTDVQEHTLIAHFMLLPESQRKTILAQLLPRLTLPELKYMHNFVVDNRPRGNMTEMLPDELLLQVCEWLNPPSLSSFARTCHRFAKIVRDNHLWKRMFDKVCLGMAMVQRSGSNGQYTSRGQGQSSVELAESLRRASTPDRPHRYHNYSLRLQQQPHRRAQSCVPVPSSYSRDYQNNSRIFKSVSLAPWKRAFKQHYMTLQNWKTGRYTVSRVSAQPGKLHTEFNVDTAVAVSIARDEAGRVWNYATGQVFARLAGHEGVITATKFNEAYVATGSTDCTVKLWDAITGVCLRSFINGHDKEIVVIDLSYDLLISGGEDGVAVVWQLATGQMLQRLVGHTGAVLGVKRDIRTNSIVTSSADHSLKRWSLTNYTCTATLIGHTAEVFCVCLHRDYIISGSGDCTIKLWNSCSHSCVRTLEGHLSSVVCIEVDSNKIVSGSADGAIKVWDMQSSQPLYTLKQHSSAVHNLRFNHSKLVSSAFDYTLFMYDFEAPLCVPGDETQDNEDEDNDDEL